MENKHVAVLCEWRVVQSDGFAFGVGASVHRSDSEARRFEKFWKEKHPEMEVVNQLPIIVNDAMWEKINIEPHESLFHIACYTLIGE